MGSFGVFTQRTGRLVTLAALVTATLAQGLAPVLASAAQVTDRSVELSSSSKAATGVSYKVNFTSVGSAGAMVVQFCDDTPLIGETCTAPTGFSASAVTTPTSGAAISGTTAATANKVVVTDTIATASAVSIELAGITNPSAAGTIYARVVTYDTDGNAANYSSDGATLGAGVVDQGSVALAITDTVGVSGAVLESMTFCVAGGATEIAANCNGGGALLAPTVALGEDDGSGVTALSATALSTGTIQTQMSTNASSGAVVSLKSNVAGCGGLWRAGALSSVCDIPAAGISTNTVVFGTAGFGVKTGTDVTGADGSYKANANYDATNYHMNWVTGDATGVTSVYGDPILDTDGGPANSLNMPLTFGVSVANNTPAGNYTADLSLIATGKF